MPKVSVLPETDSSHVIQKFLMGPDPGKEDLCWSSFHTLLGKDHYYHRNLTCILPELNILLTKKYSNSREGKGKQLVLSIFKDFYAVFLQMCQIQEMYNCQIIYEHVYVCTDHPKIKTTKQPNKG